MAAPTPDQAWIRPDDSCDTGVLVLAGSSGAVEAERAALLASYGALDRLAPPCDRLTVPSDGSWSVESPRNGPDGH